MNISESPLHLALSWKCDTDAPAQSVGTFKLDLGGLLNAGYIRSEDTRDQGAVRLRIVRTDDGSFWIQSRSDLPRLGIPVARGSKLRVQQAVNKHADVLDDAVRAALSMTADDRIAWRSPLRGDGFQELRDEAALRVVDALPLKIALRKFWPARGPVWDALATTASGKKLFVEAKAHIRELISPPSKALAADSAKRIQKALRETRAFIAPRSDADWSSTFYQYANRLAYLYFLREKNGVDTHLVFVGFTGDHDMKGPSSPEAWEAAYTVIEGALGIQEHRLRRYVHHVTMDVSVLADDIA